MQGNLTKKKNLLIYINPNSSVLVEVTEISHQIIHLLTNLHEKVVNFSSHPSLSNVISDFKKTLLLFKDQREREKNECIFIPIKKVKKEEEKNKDEQ